MASILIKDTTREQRASLWVMNMMLAEDTNLQASTISSILME